MINNSQNINKGPNGGNDKEGSGIKDVRESRFSFHEIFVVVIIVLLITGMVAPMVVKYVEQAKDNALNSQANAVWILTITALLLDEYTDKDLKKFEEKYSEYQKLEEIEKEELLLEKYIMNRVQKLDSDNYFVKMEFRDSELKAVYVSNDKYGKKVGSYRE